MALASLHVLDAGSALFDWPVLRGLHASGQDVIILGPEGARRRACAVAPGLRVLGCASAPRWSARSNAAAVRRVLSEHRCDSRVALTWGDRPTAVLSRTGLARTVPVPADLWRVPPTPDASRLDQARRSVVREDLGVSGNELLITGFGPNHGVDAYRIAHVAGVLSYAGQPATVAVPRDCANLERAMNLIRRHHHAWRLVIAEAEHAETLRAADLALCVPRLDGPPLSDSALATIESKTDWFRACGVPVVASSTGTDRQEDLEIVRQVRAALASDQGPDHPTGDRFESWCASIDRLTAPHRQSA